MLRGLSAAAAILLISATASAEPVRVDTKGRARPMIRIFRDGESDPIKVCVRGCSAELPQGRYRIAVAATPGTYAYDEEVIVRGPTRVAVDPGEKDTRRAFITLGWTFVGVSVPLFAYSLIWEWKDNPEDGSKGRFGPLIIAASAVAGVGLICLASAISYKPSITSHDVAIAIAPTKDGAALGAAWRF